MNESVKRFLILSGACLMVLALVNYLTQPLIRANQLQASLDRLSDLVPVSMQGVLSQEHIEALATQGFTQVVQHCTQVILIQTQAQGYSGPLQVVTSLLQPLDKSPEPLSVYGVRVLPPHQETPGLGDVIEPRVSGWIHQFSGIAAKREPHIDTVSGATISTSAVIKAFSHAIQTSVPVLRDLNKGFDDEC